MKFYGDVAFWEKDVEIKPGIWKPVGMKIRPYYGDVLEDNRRFQTNPDSQNDTFKVNNQISIVSDLYAQQNWASIKYIVWNGIKWKVSSVKVSDKRLIIDIGEVWNEDEKN